MKIFLTLLVIFSSFFVFSLQSFSKPESWFGATTPVAKYENDEAYNPNYVFGNIQSYLAYKEPDFSIGLNLPSPFANPDYQSYNIIIEINDSETNENSDLYGPPQTMRIYSKTANNSKRLLNFWAISTGIDSASTKKGAYRPQRFSSRHWSGEYDAPMFFSVFFDAGKAFHSSLANSDIELMGKQRSSHGCVHVEDHRAMELFHLIGNSGYGSVDLIAKNGKLVRNSRGETEKITSYKTLILIH